MPGIAFGEQPRGRGRSPGAGRIDVGSVLRDQHPLDDPPRARDTVGTLAHRAVAPQYRGDQVHMGGRDSRRTARARRPSARGNRSRRARRCARRAMLRRHRRAGAPSRAVPPPGAGDSARRRVTRRRDRRTRHALPRRTIRPSSLRRARRGGGSTAQPATNSRPNGFPTARRAPAFNPAAASALTTTAKSAGGIAR